MNHLPPGAAACCRRRRAAWLPHAAGGAQLAPARSQAFTSLHFTVQAAGAEGVISEADYLCSTLLELEIVDAEVLAKVREQFFRLDTRAAGFLSMDGYNSMLSLKHGGARCRWVYAASMTMQERTAFRVVDRIREQRETMRGDTDMSSRLSRPRSASAYMC